MRTAIITDYEVDARTQTITFNWYDPEDALEKDENYVVHERHTAYCMKDIRQKRMYIDLIGKKGVPAGTCVDAAFNLRSLSMCTPFLARWSKVHEQWVFV